MAVNAKIREYRPEDLDAVLVLVKELEAEMAERKRLEEEAAAKKKAEKKPKKEEKPKKEAKKAAEEEETGEQPKKKAAKKKAKHVGVEHVDQALEHRIYRVNLIEEAQRSAVAAREEALDKARQEAEQIVADGQAAAEEARAHVIAQAQEEAQRTEAAMVQHLDRAVQFVLKQVTGQA